MISDLIKYFFITAGVLSWFYVIGFALVKLLKIKSSSFETNSLLILLIGLTINVVLFAMCKTNFNTSSREIWKNGYIEGSITENIFTSKKNADTTYNSESWNRLLLTLISMIETYLFLLYSQ